MKVLILGATGMLVTPRCGCSPAVEVARPGELRAQPPCASCSRRSAGTCGVGRDIEDIDGVMRVLLQVRPEVVINCVGLVKQHALAQDAAAAIQINALLPHRLAKLCQLANARLIHISTDCVFAGARGTYRSSIVPTRRTCMAAASFSARSTTRTRSRCALRSSGTSWRAFTPDRLVSGTSGPIKGFKRAIFLACPP